jgi:hypothetical protein
MNTKYLDKVVEFLVDDTIIENNELDEMTYPFIPNRKTIYYITPITHVQYGSPFYNHFSNYCNSMYGLTEDEVKYVWGHYTDIINHKINSKPMNESIDNKKEKYLDKIVEYLVDDTFIDYDREEIKYPYYSNILLLHNHQLPFSVHSFRAFSIYCKDMYGLDIEEIQYVWKHYREKIVQK